MGFLNQAFNKAKELDEKQREYFEKERGKKELKKQRKIEEIKNNIFEGIKVNAMFPDKELKIKSHGMATKGIATLSFGLIGLAATSGVKQEEKNRTMMTVFQVAEKGVVFKNATSDGKDLRIPYDNIIDISLHEVKAGKVKITSGNLILTLLENQKINIRILGIVAGKKLNIIINHLLDVINERANGGKYEENGWGLEHTENVSSENEEKIEPDSIANELEKVVELYQKGLLTDEEFTTMKKRIIEK